MFILDWKNITGVHCGSVAIRNVINYFGTDYPEELCFGLGAGMGFFYNKNNESKPSEVIHLRAPNMEPIFLSKNNFKSIVQVGLIVGSTWFQHTEFSVPK